VRVGVGPTGVRVRVAVGWPPGVGGMTGLSEAFLRMMGSRTSGWA